MSIIITGSSLVLLLVIGISIVPHANGLQQVAGKIELVVNPGETETFRWGLISDIDEEAELGLTAEGAGSEFISIPKTVDIGPRQSVYVSVNVTIPAEHPGSVTLKPVVYATQFGKPGGPTIINIQMQKTLTIIIEANPDSRFRTLEVKSFVQEVKVGGSDIQLSIQSSSEISEFALDEQKKRISFRVSGMAGTNGTALIPISKALEGPYNVMIDEKPISDYETIKNDTSAETSIKINYNHSVHTITITGTSVVPEFPLPIVGFAAVLIGLMLVFGRTKFLKGGLQGQQN
jgi:hypothetical protein